MNESVSAQSDDPKADADMDLDVPPPVPDAKMSEDISDDNESFVSDATLVLDHRVYAFDHYHDILGETCKLRLGESIDAHRKRVGALLEDARTSLGVLQSLQLSANQRLKLFQAQIVVCGERTGANDLRLDMEPTFYKSQAASLISRDVDRLEALARKEEKEMVFLKAQEKELSRVISIMRSSLTARLRIPNELWYIVFLHTVNGWNESIPYQTMDYPYDQARTIRDVCRSWRSMVDQYPMTRLWTTVNLRYPHTKPIASVLDFYVKRFGSGKHLDIHLPEATVLYDIDSSRTSIRGHGSGTDSLSTERVKLDLSKVEVLTLRSHGRDDLLHLPSLNSWPRLHTLHLENMMTTSFYASGMQLTTLVLTMTRDLGFRNFQMIHDLGLRNYFKDATSLRSFSWIVTASDYPMDPLVLPPNLRSFQASPYALRIQQGNGGHQELRELRHFGFYIAGQRFILDPPPSLCKVVDLTLNTEYALHQPRPEDQSHALWNFVKSFEILQSIQLEGPYLITELLGDITRDDTVSLAHLRKLVLRDCNVDWVVLNRFLMSKAMTSVVASLRLELHHCEGLTADHCDQLSRIVSSVMVYC